MDFQHIKINSGDIYIISYLSHEHMEQLGINIRISVKADYSSTCLNSVTALLEIKAENGT